MPELATAVVSKVRGHDDIGLGTLLGSNIFNGLFVVGLAASICPITVNRMEAGATLAFGALTTLIAFPNQDGFIGRSRGVVLLLAYAAYVLFLVR